MDVTCDRCKAEYEFDEALLGERGTTVKCSACGHVFRVLPLSRAAARSQLQLRFARDGSVRQLSSLRELQTRIRNGEVSLDDELGREGFPFRALRDVPELKNFFLSQPGRHELNTVRAEGTYPRREPAITREPPTTRMPVHPESVSPSADDDDYEEVDSDPPEVASEPPEMSTVPPPLPGTPEREAADARRREAVARAERAIAEQRAANKTMPAPAGIPPEQRPRSFRQGTMSGVGPQGQLPPPPRMPEFGPRPRQQPVPATPAPTTRRDDAHSSELPPPGTGTVTGLPGLKPHQTLYGTPHGLPRAEPADGIRPGSTHPLANRLSSDRPSGEAKLPSGQTKLPSGQTPLPNAKPAETRSPVPPVDEVPLPKPLVEPDRFPQFKPVPSPVPGPPPRKLYLDASEKPPPRATEEGSRAWLYVALLLLAAGGGGWFGMTRMRVSGKAAVTPNPSLEAAQTVALEVSDASVAAPEAKAEPGPSELPAANAGPSGAAPKAGAPFVPPVAELEDELARRTGERPEQPDPPKSEPKREAKPEPKPEAKPEAKSATMIPPAAKPPVAKPAPVAKPEAPTKAERTPAVAGAKNDKVARAERVVAVNPKDYGAQLNLADALFARGDTAAAVSAYQQALSIRPSGSEANSGLGFALLKDGKAADALPYFDRAASSGYAEANIGLGDAYRGLGQPSSAKEAYQAYLERLPTGARSSYARTWLEKLSGGGGNRAPERSAEPEPYRPAGELDSSPQ